MVFTKVEIGNGFKAGFKVEEERKKRKEKKNSCQKSHSFPESCPTRSSLTPRFPVILFVPTTPLNTTASTVSSFSFFSLKGKTT